MQLAQFFQVLPSCFGNIAKTVSPNVTVTCCLPHDVTGAYNVQVSVQLIIQLKIQLKRRTLPPPPQDVTLLNVAYPQMDSSARLPQNRSETRPCGPLTSLCAAFKSFAKPAVKFLFITLAYTRNSTRIQRRRCQVNFRWRANHNSKFVATFKQQQISETFSLTTVFKFPLK